MLISQQDGEQCRYADGHRIVEIGQDVHRTEIGESRSQKHLNTVRNQTLHGAGEGMKKGMEKRSLEIARKMLAKGMDAEMVVNLPRIPSSRKISL